MLATLEEYQYPRASGWFAFEQGRDTSKGFFDRKMLRTMLPCLSMPQTGPAGAVNAHIDPMASETLESA